MTRRSAVTLAMLATLAYLPPLLTAPGVVAADTKQYLYLDPGRLMRTAASLWDPGAFGGWVTLDAVDTVRGESAQAILAKRAIPYLLLDETSGFSGHGAGASGRFALRYGLCLADFLAAPSLPAGRFTCPAAGDGDNWPLVRELLFSPPAQRPSFVGAGPSPSMR